MRKTRKWNIIRSCGKTRKYDKQLNCIPKGAHRGGTHYNIDKENLFHFIHCLEFKLSGFVSHISNQPGLDETDQIQKRFFF